MNEQSINLHDLCVYCGIDTSRSGFVNRIPADNVVLAYMPNRQFGADRVVEMRIRLDGYMCPDCQQEELDSPEDAVTEFHLSQAYDEGGASAVTAWVEANHADWVWSRCEQCDCATYTWPTDNVTLCSVCWSEKDDEDCADTSIPCPACGIVPPDDYCADCDIIVSHDKCDECEEGN